MTAGSGDERPPPRWSPFPVQDWATMPDPEPITVPEPPGPGPVAPGPPEVHQDTDPGLPPTGRPPRRALTASTVVTLLVLALVVAGLYGTARAGTGDGPPSSGYLPADGDGWTTVTVATTPSGTSRSVAQVESARLGGVEATQTLGDTLAPQLIGALGITGTRSPARVWRVTSLARTASATDPSAERSRFYRVDRGVELVLDSGPAGLVVYSPGLRELPADPRPGDRWTSSGRAGPDRTYVATFRAEAVDPDDPGVPSHGSAGARDCLRVTGTISYASRGIVPAEPHQVSRVWCRGRGPVTAEDHYTFAGRRLGSSETLDPTGPPPTADAAPGAPAGWAAPAGWSVRDLVPQSVEGGLPPARLPVGPAQLVPVATSSGLLLRATVQGRDVIITRPGTDGLQLLRRLHPGGSPTMISAVGGVIMVGSTDRTLTGYSTSGLRLWRTALTDAVTQPPAAVGDAPGSTDAALGVVTAAGTVIMVEPATGRIRWQRSLGADVAAPAAGSAAMLLVADRSGRLTALDASDGATRWQTDAAGVTSMITVGSTVVTDDGSDVAGRDLADGRLRWRYPHADTVRGLLGLDGLVVAATDRATVALGTDGGLRWRSAGFTDIATDGSLLAGRSGDRVVLLDRNGRVLARLGLRPARGGESRPLLRAGSSLLVTSSVFGDVEVLG